MKLDLLFTSHNRRRFTEESFATLIANTNWDLVNRLFIVDDDSTDGTLDYFLDVTREIGSPGWDVPRFENDRFGGPVNVMNHILDQSEAEVLAKIDNDVIVCPGWLESMIEVLDQAPEVDVLGMEAGFAERVQPVTALHNAIPARWIGGVGLIRTRVFNGRRPEPNNRWFGWTKFQRDHCNCAWISPDLPVFLLDKLPVEPWRSLSEEYIKKGWQRRWPVYDHGMHAYWDWWVDEQAEKTA